MSRLLEGLKIDLKFIGSHSLQPRWYKLLKVLLLVGFLVGYGLLFGLRRTIIFLATFLLLSSLVHFLYRAKTNTWRRSWLDFVVVEENGGGQGPARGVFFSFLVVPL